MLRRKTTGSVVCPSCGSLVGVNDERCYTCGRVNPGLWGFAPLLRQLGADFGFAPLVIGACSVVYGLTLLVTVAMGQPLGTGGLFNFLAPSIQVLFLFGASGAVPVFGAGRWWTVLSATWLHGGLIHILFNMLWIRQFGPATVEVIGPARTVIVYTVAGACGFALSSFAGYAFPGVPLLQGAEFTIGASASIMGLLGALVHYGRTGSSLIRREAMSYAVMVFVFGLIMPGIDNWAHAGGFAGGYLASAFLDPHTRERGDHMLIAVGCLAASLLSLVFSIVHGLGFLR